jgi:rubrerythrin
VELQWLRKAHGVERETSDFYQRMVNELPDEAKGLFKRFLEIEEGHLALVQAQIDQALGTGYWFDVREFDLEG